MTTGEQRLVRVSSVRREAVDVLSYEMLAADGRPLRPFSPGSHIDVHVPGGFIRQYSLCGNPSDSSSYKIAVKREAAGRGGSVALHEEIEPGHALGITGPRNHFALAPQAESCVFIAGGIGITPIYSMIQFLHAKGAEWILHYCARSEGHAAFFEELVCLDAGRVRPYFGEVPTLDVVALLRGQPPGAHVYCCGPQSLMTAVAAASAHWIQGTSHFEWFAAPKNDRGPNLPFDVELARSGITLHVPADRSILQVLRDNGFEVASACEEGLCGACEVRLCAGRPDHRDMLLTGEERSAGRSLMVCISRAQDAKLVLDL